MNALRIALACWLACSMCWFVENAVAENKTKPNFVFFITDDISYNDLGCYGNRFVRTPNLDRIAKAGMVFDNAYLTASSCSPSRCSIITGRYPHNTGAPELHMKLPEGQFMFPQALREAGYYTVLSGKNHIGPETKKAFDKITNGGGPSGSEDWIKHLRDRPKDKPFFFWFASRDAHRGWQKNEQAHQYDPDKIKVPPFLFDGPKTREDLAAYYHEVSRTDYFAGEIVKELKRQGIADNTYFVYCADNGRPFPRCKTRLYDSGIKTPLIVWSPGNVKPARTESLVSAIDFSATFLELAGCRIDQRVQGVSFVPLLSDPGKEIRDAVFAEHNWHVYQAHERMVRTRKWHYIANAYPELQSRCMESIAHFPAGQELDEAFRAGKLNQYQKDCFSKPRPKSEFYQVDSDPDQLKNLVEPEQAFSNQATDSADPAPRSYLLAWQSETGDSIPDQPTLDRGKKNSPQQKKWERGEIPGGSNKAHLINKPGPGILKAAWERRKKYNEQIERQK